MSNGEIAAATPAPKPHSKLGIASCAGAVAMFLLFVSGALVLHFAFGSYPQEPWLSSDVLFLLPVLAVMVLPIPVHVLGFVLGLVALFFPDRRRLFPFLGMILNSVFGLCGLIPWVWLALHAPGVR